MKIDKGILLPTRSKKYPLDQLNVGDSFFVFCNGEEPIRVRARISPTMTRIYHATKKRFKSRLITENGIAGVRVWRVE